MDPSCNTKEVPDIFLFFFLSDKQIACTECEFNQVEIYYLGDTTRTEGSSLHVRVFSPLPPSSPLFAFPSFSAPLYVPRPLITVRGQVCLASAGHYPGPDCPWTPVSVSWPRPRRRHTSPAILKATLAPWLIHFGLIQTRSKARHQSILREIITHSLAICLTSTPSWHWKRSL